MRRNSLRLLEVLAFLLAMRVAPSRAQQANPSAPPVPQLRLTIPAFGDGGRIPVKYTCAAKPRAESPMLEWNDVPKGTVTFALITHDMDGQPQKGVMDVTHWMIWNIPANVRHLPQGVPPTPQSPDGMVQGKNVRGETGYRGPCAPPASRTITRLSFMRSMKSSTWVPTQPERNC